MSKNQQFQKFITYKSNAAKKEGFKQEKKALKRERAAAIEKRFEEKRRMKEEARTNKSGTGSTKNGITISKEEIRTLKAAAGNKNATPGKYSAKVSSATKPAFEKKTFDAKKENTENRNKKAVPKKLTAIERHKNPHNREQKIDNRKENFESKQISVDKKQPKLESRNTGFTPNTNKKPAFEQKKADTKKYTPDNNRKESFNNKQQAPATSNRASAPKKYDVAESPLPTRHGTADSDAMPLNKYVAHSGVCSRRDAADIIRNGDVKVNDIVIKEPGTKVSPNDTITVKGKKITPSKNLVYILLNKPKDYITTLDDPEGRRTVLDLIKQVTNERVYPVGRLDRNTSGVLLITNDGDLAQTLSHPKNLIKKIYEVHLDKPVTKADFEKIALGITLEDGFIMPDGLGYVDAQDKSIIGIEIHSGRNRIVRRIFEHLGYDVRQLDRVTYAGLTKKNVQRGKWRFLTEKEVRILHHFNPQTKKEKEKKVKPTPKKRIDKY